MSTTISQARKKTAVQQTLPGVTARGDAKTLAGVCLELLDYITKHSDDSTELNDSVKWKLEAILRSPE